MKSLDILAGVLLGLVGLAAIYQAFAWRGARIRWARA